MLSAPLPTASVLGALWRGLKDAPACGALELTAPSALVICGLTELPVRGGFAPTGPSAGSGAADGSSSSFLDSSAEGTGASKVKDVLLLSIHFLNGP
jgi:hypothetical protein